MHLIHRFFHSAALETEQNSAEYIMNSILYLSKWGRALAKTLIKPRQKYKPVVIPNRWNIVRGDLVQVIQGPQTGQKGKVLAVIREKNRVIIENVNMVGVHGLLHSKSFSKYNTCRIVCRIIYAAKPLREAHHGRHAGAQSREALLATLLEYHVGRSNYGVG
jgi:hypothetical protein